jgi:hypothetical protein
MWIETVFYTYVRCRNRKKVFKKSLTTIQKLAEIVFAKTSELFGTLKTNGAAEQMTL